MKTLAVVLLLAPLYDISLRGQSPRSGRQYRLYQTVKQVTLETRTKDGHGLKIPKGTIILSEGLLTEREKKSKNIETILGKIKSKNLKLVTHEYGFEEFHIPQEYCSVDTDRNLYLCQNNFPKEGDTPREFSLKTMRFFIDDFSTCDPKDSAISIETDVKRLKRLETVGPKHESVYIYTDKKSGNLLQFHVQVGGWECY